MATQRPLLGVPVPERAGAGAPSIVLIAVAKFDHAIDPALDAKRFAVIQVRDGATALEWARALHPDAIVLDSALPDMPAVEVCQQLQGVPGIGHRVPILILAADKP